MGNRIVSPPPVPPTQTTYTNYGYSDPQYAFSQYNNNASNNMHNLGSYVPSMVPSNLSYSIPNAAPILSPLSTTTITASVSTPIYVPVPVPNSIVSHPTIPSVPKPSSQADAAEGSNVKQETTSAKMKEKRLRGGTHKQQKLKPKLKQSRGLLTEEELKERRKKHNEVEIRRRKRIKASFSELGQLCGCDSKQKRIILANAIDLIKQYEDKIEHLQSSIESIDQEAKATDATAAETSSVSVEGAPSTSVSDPNAHAVDHDSVFYSSGVPLYIAAFDGRILDCNSAFAKLFGYSREHVIELQTTTLFALTSPDALSNAFSIVSSLMNGSPSVQTTLIVIGPQGQPKRVKLTAWSVREQGKAKYFMGMLIPIPDNDTSSTASNFSLPAPANSTFAPSHT